MANLQQAINEFRTVLENNLTGITRVYERAPNSINEFPSLIILPSQGRGEIVSSQFGRTEHTVLVEIYDTTQDLDKAIKSSELWESKILQVLQEFHDLNGTIEHFIYPVEYRTGPIIYNNEQVYYGTQFRISFKQNRIY